MPRSKHPSADMPPVTEDHRRRAFAALKLVGITYEQAMADATRRQLVEACAATLRKREWQSRNTRFKPR